jgi:hypothetical protein
MFSVKLVLEHQLDALLAKIHLINQFLRIISVLIDAVMATS